MKNIGSIKNLLFINFYYSFFKNHELLANLLIVSIYIIFHTPQLIQAAQRPDVSTNLLHFTIIIILCMTILLFLRSQYPRFCLYSALIIPFILSAIEILFITKIKTNIVLPLLLSSSILDPAAIVIFLYTIGRKLPLKSALLHLIITSMVIFTLELFTNRFSNANYSPVIINITIYTIAILIGSTLQFQTSKVLQLEQLNKQLELERKQHEQLTISAERTRIAREMHDIVAHSLAIVITMADGAEAMIEKNPSLAKQAINQIGQTGRSALQETRRLVGILRENTEINTEDMKELIDNLHAASSRNSQGSQLLGGLKNNLIQSAKVSNSKEKLKNQLKSQKNKKELSAQIQRKYDNSTIANTSNSMNDENGPLLTPQPNTQTIEMLIDEFKNAGLPIKYNYIGEIVEDNTTLGLTIYRIIQESLTNILRYAPFSPEVKVDINRFKGGMTITIKNKAGASTSLMKGSGKGIIGMRERVAIFDGYVQAGPTQEGWEVKAYLRLEDTKGEPNTWTAPI